MAGPRAFILNFDADDELAAPARYTPSPGVLARFPSLTERVRALLAPGDVVLGVDVARVDPGTRALCWCPTPRALEVARAAGAHLPDAPPLAVLRAVNHRRFAAMLGEALPGARFVTTAMDAEAMIASASPSGTWLLKRAFGFAGRGQRRVRAGAVTDADLRWARASFGSDGGLQIEPLVERVLDVGLHGFLSREGALALGEPTVQAVDASGVWRGSARAAPGALTGEEREALQQAAEESAVALRDAGYWGPFGVDAFRWIDGAGRRQFCARCEINARYSMGWAIGMGSVRPDLA